MSVISTSRRKLESGDRLTQCEFHRRYLDSPDLKKAELVEGVVYVPSPVGQPHAERHGRMSTWLGVYRARHPELRLSDNGTVILDADNEVQPDLCLWRVDDHGPRIEDGYLHGAPQLIVEIAASSVSYDLHDKLNAYRRAGVLEYVVWRVDDEAIDWFRLMEGRYERVAPDPAGIVESVVFPGLRLPLASMLADDMDGVLAELERRGHSSPQLSPRRTQRGSENSAWCVTPSYA